MSRRYKISVDSMGWFNVYYKYWFWPFWIKSNSWISSFRNIEDAKQYIEKLKNPVYIK